MSDAEIRNLERAASEGQPGAADCLQRVRLEFFVALMPRQKNKLQARLVGGHARIAATPEMRERQATLASVCYEHRPPSPLRGPVRLDVFFVMPIPSGWPKWKQEAARGGTLYPTSRPDRGNLLKLLEDALKGVFYVDDSLVVDGNVGKRYGETPGYRIVLEEIPHATRPVRVKKQRVKNGGAP